ncbi:ribonucleotide reductase, all-alpha domain protein, partial [Arthrospira sp. O9.13F]
MQTLSTTTDTPFNRQIQVIRRDGSLTLLDVSRIRAVVNWACEGLDTKP